MLGRTHVLGICNDELWRRVVKNLMGLLLSVTLAGSAFAHIASAEDGYVELPPEWMEKLALVQEASLEQGTDSPTFTLRGSGEFCVFFNTIKETTSDGDIHYKNVDCVSP